MLRRFFPVLVFLANLLPAYSSDVIPISLDTIVKILQARDKALTSFEIQGRSFVSDEAGERVPNSVLNEFSYSQTSKGERELREILIAPDGVRTVSSWIRDDGTKLYTMQCTPKSEDVIEYVVIKETPNQPSRSVMPIIPYLNILSPRGKRLAALVATGKSMSIVDDENGDKIVELQVTDGGISFGLRLSGDHDYVPREVIFAERDRKVVTSYRNIDGFWFPESGYSKQVDSKGGDLRLAFQVDRISVNPVKSPKDFGLPKLNVGTVIHNETKSGPRGVFGVSSKDDDQARRAVEELRGKYGSISETAKAANPSTKLVIAATADPEGSVLPKFILVLGASFALIVAGFLLWRR